MCSWTQKLYCFAAAAFSLLWVSLQIQQVNFRQPGSLPEPLQKAHHNKILFYQNLANSLSPLLAFECQNIQWCILISNCFGYFTPWNTTALVQMYFNLPHCPCQISVSHLLSALIMTDMSMSLPPYMFRLFLDSCSLEEAKLRGKCKPFRVAIFKYRNSRGAVWKGDSFWR